MSRYETATWKELVHIQNMYFENQDILTITGFMKTDEELEAHLARYKKLIAEKTGQ